MHTRGSSPDSSDDLWQSARIRLRPDLRFESRELGGEPSYLIADLPRHKYFQVGGIENKIIQACDGRATVAEIAALLAADDARVSSEQVGLVTRWLVQNQLAAIEGADNVTRLQERSRKLAAQKRWGLAHLICWRVPLFDPTRLLERCRGLADLAWHPLGWTIWVIVIALGLGVVATDFERLSSNCVGVLAGSRWVWLLVIWIGLKILHELGHGLACRKFGGGVPEAGVLLLLFTPLAYVNVTSSWQLASRWQRIAVSSAGMAVELLVAALAVIAWSNLNADSLLRDLCLNTFLMAGATTLLFNANPLMRFDGYYILSDMLDIPNLYLKGNAWIRDRVRGLVLGFEPVQPRLTARERWIVPVYGLCSMVWRLAVTIGLLIAASVLFHGLGWVIAGAALFSWYLAPQWRQLNEWRRNPARQRLPRRRLAIVAGCLAAFSAALFFVFGSPINKSAPAITRFEEETLLRAASAGFIAEILVDDGQSVEAGQPLLKLENEFLGSELTTLQLQAEESAIQARIYLQHQELAKYQAELERAASLNRQLLEKQRQVDELTIRAPFTGIVLQRDLRNRQGCFVQQGEPLITLAKTQRLEVIVSIAQEDFAQLVEGQSTTLRAVFGGLAVTECQIQNRNPAASTVPVHLALCASHGGPLPVRPMPHREENNRDPQSVELLSPRFNLELSLDTHSLHGLRSGQQGKVIFPVRQYSLGAYLYLSIREWLEEKVRAAMKT